jgi:hypothetical protein
MPSLKKGARGKDIADIRLNRISSRVAWLQLGSVSALSTIFIEKSDGAGS